MSINFSSFGSFGPQFQVLINDTILKWANCWDRIKEDHRNISLENAQRECLGRSGFWFERVMAIGMLGQFKPNDMVKLWPMLQATFSPKLSDGGVLSRDTKAVQMRAKLLECLQRAMMDSSIIQRRAELNNICYGPCTDTQIEALRKAPGGLLEVGAGSGYLLSVLKGLGADVLGLDSNVYGLSDSNQTFTQELVNEGKLIQGGPELIGQHLGARSMLISYPEGGSAFPAQALEAFANAGGTRLYLKLGGFIGRFNPPQGLSYVPPKNPVSNILRFFELLCRDWVEVERDRCPYECALYTNNLWEFRRKPTTKQLRDLGRKKKK